MKLPRNPRNQNKILNSESGFTLIEIIAVLVILSILAVVAVPKYFDLQTEAQTKALQGAMAEAIGRVNSHFAKSLLGGSAWDEIVYSTTDTSLGSDLGDFTITTVTPSTASPWTIYILITGKDGTAVGGATISRTIPMPGAP